MQNSDYNAVGAISGLENACFGCSFGESTIIPYIG